MLQRRGDGQRHRVVSGGAVMRGGLLPAARGPAIEPGLRLWTGQDSPTFSSVGLRGGGGGVRVATNKLLPLVEHWQCVNGNRKPRWFVEQQQVVQPRGPS